jgi:integrase
MFFVGLRPGEARGICWEHYDGKWLFVTPSVRHKFTTDPKTLDAANPVPVIETLAEILNDLAERGGNFSTGPIL